MALETTTLFDEADALSRQIDASPVGNAAELEAFRIQFLGTKGLLKQLFGRMGEVPADRKREFGQRVNAVKELAETKFNDAKTALEAASAQAGPDFDLTLPPLPPVPGSRHPINLVRQKIVDTFARIGYAVAEGPEVEDDWHNFTAMGTPEDHPARDMQDTFYIAGHANMLLRTHTSPVQARVMESQKPPIRIIVPGRTYRNETISARAHCVFHQVEGLYVDENVSFADLKQTLLYFAQVMFGEKTQIRLRPSYFPFTEPSAEMDVTCLICHGEGCPVCKHSGWVEILGCGMVDPQVFENCGIDPERYTGFAFGMGIERIAMLTYGVDDIRLFTENDLRFLEQFKAEA
ncbi:MAG: phenylalanine--tRNA ligase subunit alpha [Bacteroidetes bacterium]|nr:phenylalanine--tRNA ligase subunit alpha [Bacteroidota bacterium]